MHSAVSAAGAFHTYRGMRMTRTPRRRAILALLKRSALSPARVMFTAWASCRFCSTYCGGATHLLGRATPFPCFVGSSNLLCFVLQVVFLCSSCLVLFFLRNSRISDYTTWKAHRGCVSPVPAIVELHTRAVPTIVELHTRATVVPSAAGCRALL